MDEIEELIIELKSPDEQVCLNAFIKLNNYGGYFDPLVPALIDALKSGFPSVRARAAIFLGQVGDKSALTTLIETLRDENPSVRARAAAALGYIRDPMAIPALIETLKDSDWVVQCNSASALGQIFEECSDSGSQEFIFQFLSFRSSAISALTEFLKSENLDVRIHSATALGRIGSPSSLPALIEALMDGDTKGQSKAEEALRYILEIRNTIEHLREYDEKLNEKYASLGKKYRKKEDIRKLEKLITDLKIELSRKKDELAQNKGVLLTDVPKPPKPGTMYKSMRRVA